MKGYRKYSIIVAIILIAVIFRLSNHINGKEMVELIKVSAVAFFSANMVNKITSYVKDRVKKL